MESNQARRRVGACRGLTLPLMLATTVLRGAAAAVTLYVSPQGDDRATGRSEEAALRTFERARDVARQLRRDGQAPDGVTVLAEPGVYTLTAPLLLGEDDAATKDAPLVFVSDGDGEAVVRGGPAVIGFEQHEGEVLRCDLSGTGLRGKLFNQLFFAGRRMPVARAPNVDATDIHGGVWAHAVGGTGPDAKRCFRYGKDIDPSRWSQVEGARVGVFCRFDWRWNRRPIEAVDPVRRVLQLRSPATYEIHPGDRYFVENVYEELDAPGEWFLDRATSILYFWPPSPLGDSTPVTVALADRLVAMDGARYVTVGGFAFEGCTGTAVEIRNSQGCRVERSVITNCGGWGAAVSGGSECAVVGCDISYTGHGGISLSGGDRKTLTAARNLAENNVIHHVGVFEKTYNTGVNVSGVGNRVRHNLIHDTPHAGMTLAGNDNVIEFNHIHHTNLQSTDTGGLYSCPRDWTQRGNVVRHNLWHDIGGFGKKSSWQPVQEGVVPFVYPHYTWGVYMDDPTSGNRIYGNILYRVPVCAFHNHGGRDNVFENNIVVDCPAFSAGMLSPGWGEWDNIRKRLHAVTQPGSPYLERYPALRKYRDEFPEEMSGIRFVRNIITYTVAGTNWLRQREGWGSRQRLYRYTVRQEDLPKNVFDYNVIHVPPELTLSVSLCVRPGKGEDVGWEEWQRRGGDRHSVLADPGFVDVDGLDFRLRPDSPALALGFKPIPVDKIGPYADPSRASWPLVDASDAARTAKPIRREIELFERHPARKVVARSGLANTVRKLKAGGPVRIAYYGGGVHPPGGWRKAFLQWLGETYPESEVSEINAGICDCVRGSAFSVYRFGHDVLDQKPDLVLVDFASDDHTTAPGTIHRSIEGIVRQTWARAPEIDLMFVYAFRAGFEQAYGKDLSPTTVSAYETIAEHYGVPSVNMGLPVAKGFHAGTVTIRGDPVEGKVPFSTDGVRPTAQGNRLYAKALAEGFGQIAAAPGVATHPLPAAYGDGSHEHARQVAISESMLSGDWQPVPDTDELWGRCRRHFDSLWHTKTPGASMTFRFRGTSAALFHLFGPDTGRVRVTIDGADRGATSRVDKWSYFHRLGGLVLASGLPDGEHTVSVELLPDPPNRTQPIDEAKRLGRYTPEAFEGTTLYIGAIRLVGELM